MPYSISSLLLLLLLLLPLLLLVLLLLLLRLFPTLSLLTAASALPLRRLLLAPPRLVMDSMGIAYMGLILLIMNFSL